MSGTMPVSTVADIVSGGTPKTSVSEYWNGPIPWISIADFNTDYRWLSWTEQTITDEGLYNSPTEVLNAGDIIISARGTVGAIAQLSKPMAFNQSCYGLRAKPQFSINSYLYYALKYSLKNIKSFVHGAVFDTITKKTFDDITVYIPPLPEQRRIAHILGTLDDKIENNRKTAKTLEAMAQAIFQSWFVDFDPVRAKASGESTESICNRLKMTPEILALFPDGFEDSELGKIPRGWKVGTIGQIISQATDRVEKKDAVVLSAVSTGSLVRSEDYFNKRVYSADISKYITVQQWDIAYNPSRINIGSIGMLKDPIRGAVSPVYVVARPQPEYRWFLEFLLNNPDIKSQINTLSSGSVRQSLSYSNFSSIRCIIPPSAIALSFSSLWQLVYTTSDHIVIETQHLSETRDTLLPKLISGELRVDGAEELVEEAIG